MRSPVQVGYPRICAFTSTGACLSAEVPQKAGRRRKVVPRIDYVRGYPDLDHNSDFGFMNGQNRNNVKPGAKVLIVLKEDQPTGQLTLGVVKDILTSKKVHPRGIKVRLTNGLVGRVQEVL